MSTLTAADRPTADRGVDPAPVSWRDRMIVAAWSLAVSIVIFAPLLGSRGGVLRNNLLFVPRQPFKAAWLGLDGSVPSSVPYDFLVAIGNWIVPGDLVQKVLLVLALFLAGTGGGAAAARLGLVGQLVTATFFVWNPWVYERIATGDLGFLFGYAALGWIVWAAMRPNVTDGLRGLAPVVLGLALAGWTSPTFGVISLLVAICVIATRRWETALWTVVAGILVNLPWIVPGLIRPGGILPDSTGVAGYAANPDTGLGVFGSLLTLGGVWDPGSAAPGRTNAVVTAIALVLTLLGVLGAALAWGRTSRGPIIGLTVATVLGLVIALLGAYSSTRSAIEAIVENVPGGILLRDGHAWIAPLALLLAFGLGSLVTYLWQLGGMAIGAVAAVIAIAAPIALLPGLALALDGNLTNESYPAGWWRTRGALASSDHKGVAVLPLGNDRDYKWNSNGKVVNPASYFFLGDVLVDDSRTVNGVVVNGNDPQAAMLRTAVADKGTDLVATLLKNGYDTLVVDRGARGTVPKIAPAERTVVHRNGAFFVYHLTGTVGAPARPAAVPILIGDVLSAGTVLGALAFGFGVIGRRRRDEAAPTATDGEFARPEGERPEPTEEFTAVLPEFGAVPTVSAMDPYATEAQLDNPVSYDADAPMGDTARSGYQAEAPDGYAAVTGDDADAPVSDAAESGFGSGYEDAAPEGYAAATGDDAEAPMSDTFGSESGYEAEAPGDEAAAPVYDAYAGYDPGPADTTHDDATEVTEGTEGTEPTEDRPDNGDGGPPRDA